MSALSHVLGTLTVIDSLGNKEQMKILVKGAELAIVKVPLVLLTNDARGAVLKLMLNITKS